MSKNYGLVTLKSGVEAFELDLANSIGKGFQGHFVQRAAEQVDVKT